MRAKQKGIRPFSTTVYSEIDIKNNDNDSHKTSINDVCDESDTYVMNLYSLQQNKSYNREKYGHSDAMW